MTELGFGLPAEVTYCPDTKEVYNSWGMVVNTCESVNEFLDKYEGRRYAIHSLKLDYPLMTEENRIEPTVQITSRYKLKHK